MKKTREQRRAQRLQERNNFSCHVIPIHINCDLYPDIACSEHQLSTILGTAAILDVRLNYIQPQSVNPWQVQFDILISLGDYYWGRGWQSYRKS